MPQKDRQVFYFKFLEAGDKLEVNALSSKSENEIFSSEFQYLSFF